MKMLACQACGGVMKKKTMSSGNCPGLLVALLVLAVGVALTIAVPIIGWVFGPILILLSLFMGEKRQKVWRCGSCRSFVFRS
jgi:hypothetical protein